MAKKPDSGVAWPWEEDAPTAEDRRRATILDSAYAEAVIDHLKRRINTVGVKGLTGAELAAWTHIHSQGSTPYDAPEKEPATWTSAAKTGAVAAYAVGLSFWEIGKRLAQGKLHPPTERTWKREAKKLGIKVDEEAARNQYREYIEGKQPARRKPARNVHVAQRQKPAGRVSAVGNAWYEREYRKFKDEQWERTREETLEGGRKALMRAMAADPKVWQPKPRPQKSQQLSEQRRSGR